MNVKTFEETGKVGDRVEIVAVIGGNDNEVVGDIYEVVGTWVGGLDYKREGGRNPNSQFTSDDGTCALGDDMEVKIVEG